MGNAASIRPSDFTTSPLQKAAHEYVLPDKDEPKSRFSVSSFPTKLLDTIRYAVPLHLPGKWRKSTANVDRLLFSVGIPLLEDATANCRLYSTLMADAISDDNDTQHIELRSKRLRYDVDDMKMHGGKEAAQGGTKLQCLNRDVLAVNDIATRLAGVRLSTLVPLALVWALSSDTDCQIVTSKTQEKCQKITEDFLQRLAKWEQELQELRR